MASADLLDSPVHLVRDLPGGPLLGLLVPARRWRAVVSTSTEIEYDVLLQAVARLRSAGITSASRTADLLQLPHELVEHLHHRVAHEQVRVAPSGALESAKLSTVWVYRDRVTSDLWPDTGSERAPLPVRMGTAQREAVLPLGTAGRPWDVPVLILEPGEHPCSRPSPIELARLGHPTRDPSRRTAVVSGEEDCLLVAPLRRTTSGVIVESSRGALHLGLTRHLAELAERMPLISRWLRKVPGGNQGRATVLPLEAAVLDLRTAVERWEEHTHEWSARAVLSGVELALRRYCDQVWYRAGQDEPVPGQATDPARVAALLSLTEADARRIIEPGEDTLGGRIASFAARPEVQSLGVSPAAVGALAICWLDAWADPTQSDRIVYLTKQTLHLCEDLLEDSDGQ